MQEEFLKILFVFYQFYIIISGRTKTHLKLIAIELECEFKERRFLFSRPFQPSWHQKGSNRHHFLESSLC